MTLTTADEKCDTCHCYTIERSPQTQRHKVFPFKFLAPHLSLGSTAALS